MKTSNLITEYKKVYTFILIIITTIIFYQYRGALYNKFNKVYNYYNLTYTNKLDSISIYANAYKLQISRYENYKYTNKTAGIIFDTNKSAKDIITLFILQSSTYRLGLKVETYLSTASAIYNFEFTKNTVSNLNVYSHYLNTNIPSLKAESLALKSACIGCGGPTLNNIEGTKLQTSLSSNLRRVPPVMKKLV